MNFNKVIIVGRLVKDIEIKTAPSGTKITNFTIVTNRYSKGESIPEYHNVVAFEKLAEIVVKYAEKGQSLLVEGRISTSSWEKDGKKNYKTDIIADSIQLGSKPNA